MKTPKAGSGTLTTRSKDNQENQYIYTWELDSHRDENNVLKAKWCFCIVEGDELFQFDVVDEGTYLRVQDMNRNGSDKFKAKGIPEAFIRLCNKMFGLRIASSKNVHAKSQTGATIAIAPEQHSPDATKVWERLVALDEAEWDLTEERYFYPKGRCCGKIKRFMKTI